MLLLPELSAMSDITAARSLRDSNGDPDTEQVAPSTNKGMDFILGQNNATQKRREICFGRTSVRCL